MQGLITTDSRPEAMADVPGICELPLSRAVVQYRDSHELYHPGGRIRDIGMAVVVEGRFASSARAMDLGSAEVKYLDLTSELVILDWVYDTTLAHVRALAAGEGARSSETLRRYCFDLALRVLNRRGFTPLTRPTLLRIGFRDLCKDLDLHESTVVRILTGRGAVTRVHLDYDANALVFRATTPRTRRALEVVLREVFPGLVVGRVRAGDPAGGAVCEVRFGVPVTFGEVRKSLHLMRRGLSDLVARFEPDRFKAVGGLVAAFGARATLDRFTFAGAEDEGIGAGREVSASSDDTAGTGLAGTGMAVH